MATPKNSADIDDRVAAFLHRVRIGVSTLVGHDAQAKLDADTMQYTWARLQRVR